MSAILIENPITAPVQSTTAIGPWGLIIGDMTGPLPGAPPSVAEVGAITFLIENNTFFDIAEQSTLVSAQPSQTAVGPFTVFIQNNT